MDSRSRAGCASSTGGPRVMPGASGQVEEEEFGGPIGLDGEGGLLLQAGRIARLERHVSNPARAADDEQVGATARVERVGEGLGGAQLHPVDGGGLPDRQGARVVLA